MQHLTGRAAWIVFIFSVIALLFLGWALTRTTASFADSERWVAHTHEVETAISQVRSDLNGASSDRLAYIEGAQQRLQEYRNSIQKLPNHLQELKSLTSDNATERANLEKLEPVLNQKIDLMQRSIALQQSGNSNSQQQLEFTRTCGALMSQADLLLDSMRGEETRLLQQREIISEATYKRIRVVLGLAFVVVVLLLLATIQSLLSEIKDRRRAEAAVRRLSSRILDVRDVERRKVARELHDSIGQYFAALQMNLSLLNRQAALAADKQIKILQDCEQLVRQGMAETRTLSHLLHPPLLDEAGFASAARWYVGGYSDRGEIQVALDLPDDLPRFPREIELVLFRVLQEALTNIHKHSGSRDAQVRIYAASDGVTLTVRDSGKGIPSAVLEEFNSTTTGTGIGLAGMRERVREFGGELSIDSGPSGTQLTARMPIPRACRTNPNSGSLPDSPLKSTIRTASESGPSDPGMLLQGNFA